MSNELSPGRRCCLTQCYNLLAFVSPPPFFFSELRLQRRILITSALCLIGCCVWGDATSAPFLQAKNFFSFFVFFFADSDKFLFFYVNFKFSEEIKMDVMIISPDERRWLNCAIFLSIFFENPSQSSDPFSFSYFNFFLVYLNFFKKLKKRSLILNYLGMEVRIISPNDRRWLN